jgi:hypothetical protein
MNKLTRKSLLIIIILLSFSITQYIDMTISDNHNISSNFHLGLVGDENDYAISMA